MRSTKKTKWVGDILEQTKTTYRLNGLTQMRPTRWPVIVFPKFTIVKVVRNIVEF